MTEPKYVTLRMGSEDAEHFCLFLKRFESLVPDDDVWKENLGKLIHSLDQSIKIHNK
jgi:hypothetical protein